jgi:uncharacterized protein (TIGR03437 family)
LVSPLAAQSPPITVVSAANYGNVVAPNSIASIFGVALAGSTASAVLDANGQLPVELLSRRVEVNGQPAALLFVSPTQINLVVPDGTAVGAATVTLLSTDTNTLRLAAVQVANTAPAIFSLDATGSGPGAILNAVTFASGPFFTVTPPDRTGTSTILAVYCTGVRNAQNITASAVDNQGNRFSMAVQFAGPAPGFFGLDQVNVIVPAGMDGAGRVSFTLTTEDANSNTVTFSMAQLPLSALQLTSIAVSPQFVTGGDNLTITVSLNGVAQSGGFPVALRTTNLVAPVPPFVTIPSGQSFVNNTISTMPVTTVQTGTISARAGNVVVMTPFEVDPPTPAQLSSISTNPTTTLGGRAIQGTVTLAGPAPPTGVNVLVASDNLAVQPPTSVTVPFNTNSVNFPIRTIDVRSPLSVTLAATLNRVTVSSIVNVLPVLSLTLGTSAVIGGNSVTGTITLADPAPVTGATISLTSTDNSAAQVPTLTQIPSGQTTGTFTITTVPVTSARTTTISANYLGVTQTDQLSVNPPPAAVLSSLTLTPNQVTGGASVQGLVTLAGPAPAGGIIVNLQSSLPVAAQVPGFVIVPQGQTTSLFSITTFRVALTQTVTITASANGVTKTAMLIVQ